MKIPAILNSDSYKQFHAFMYPKNLTMLYSNFTPRNLKYIGTDVAVFFGLQYYIKEYLILQWNETFFQRPWKSVEAEYKRFHKYFSFVEDIDMTHIKKLHDLGYLPLAIKALPEGSKVPEKVPFFTIYNTVPGFGWLVNFLETQISNTVWHPSVIATLGYKYRNILDKWAIKTTGSTAGVEWQGHDFSMRGKSSMESSQMQAGWLLSFNGTDTIPAVLFLEEYYKANMEKELIGSSVPASEHSVMTSYGKENEFDAFVRLMEQFPTGILSIVSDSFDFWLVLTDYLVRLKDQILIRDGKIVIRPDSGNPADIICGTVQESYSSAQEAEDYFQEEIYETESSEEGRVYEMKKRVLVKGEILELFAEIEWIRERGGYSDANYYTMGDVKISSKIIDTLPQHKGAIELLWDTFGGTINEKGYKVLAPQIGLIYGDSITAELAEEICDRLEKKGFASTNVVLGVGSYTMNYNTRDSIGAAVKSTYCEVEVDNTILQGDTVFPIKTIEGREIFKDPITDNGTKKSAKGLLRVDLVDGIYTLKDQCTKEEEQGGELRLVFEDGYLISDQSLAGIRKRLNG